MLAKGGAAATAADEEEELEVEGAAASPAETSGDGVATSIAKTSGVAVGTDLVSSVETTMGGPPAVGANLQPETRVCPGVAEPLCSDPCLQRLQVQ